MLPLNSECYHRLWKVPIALKAPLFIFHVSYTPLFEPSVCCFVLVKVFLPVYGLHPVCQFWHLNPNIKSYSIQPILTGYFLFWGTSPCQPKHDCASASAKTSVNVWNPKTSLSATNNNATFKVTQNLFLPHSGEDTECHPFALSPTNTWPNAFGCCHATGCSELFWLGFVCLAPQHICLYSTIFRRTNPFLSLVEC